MSKKQQSLLLSVPLFMGELQVEREVFLGFKCATCCGNGWYWGEDEKSGERVKVTCKICKGSGRLKAVVIVEWVAEKI